MECGGRDAALDFRLVPGLRWQSTMVSNLTQSEIQPAASNRGPRKTPWPHAPTHQLSESGTFLVTAGTYLKSHHFRGAERLSVLHRGLLTVAHDFGWKLEAWAVFSNHYHFIGASPDHERGSGSLSRMLGLLHEKTAKWINRLERSESRQVWHNYRETLLTYQKSYLARLSYVHQNAVKHGLVKVANQYPWCSAAWFERMATPSQVRTVYDLKIDRIHVFDEYDVQKDW
jgi:putative transposase